MFVTDRGSLKGIIRSEDLMQTLPLFYDVQKDGVNSLMNALGGAAVGARRASYTSLANTSIVEDEDSDDENINDNGIGTVGIVEKIQIDHEENDGDAGAGNKK